MIYRLVVLTHGESDTLIPTLESFQRYVRPYPESVIIAHDGPGEPQLPSWWQPGPSLEGQLWGDRLGFCGASRELWRLATEGRNVPGLPSLPRMGDQLFVFWLEHDFVFLRNVNLGPMAATLHMNQRLAQVSLVREPVNSTEIEAGSVVQSHRDRGSEFVEHTTYGQRWLEHDAYFTTNPSLMNVRFMRMNPWPAHNKECEGHFGGELRRRGYSFGIWGTGSAWTKHIGERTGFGY